MNYYCTIDVRGRVTIPIAIRRALDIKPGDRLEVAINDGLVIVRVRKD